MNTTKTHALLLTCGLALGTAGTSLAGETTSGEHTPMRPQQSAVRFTDHGQAHAADRTSWHFADAKTVRNLDLTTRDGQRVGQVKDLIVDESSGEVRMYLVELNEKVPDRDGDKVVIGADRITIETQTKDGMMSEHMNGKDGHMMDSRKDADQKQDQKQSQPATAAPKDHAMSSASEDQGDQPMRCAVTDQTPAELATLAEFDPANYPTLYATTWYRQLGKNLGLVEQQNPALYDLYFLSDIDDRPIVAPAGEKLGKVKNVIVELDSETLALIVIKPDVEQVEGERILPWGVVTELANDEIRIRTAASNLANAARAPRDGDFANWGQDGQLESVYKPFGLDVPAFTNDASHAQTRRPRQQPSDDI